MARPPGICDPNSLRSRIARVLADGKPRTVHEIHAEIPDAMLKRIQSSLQLTEKKRRFRVVEKTHRQTPRGMVRLYRYTLAELGDGALEVAESAPLADAPVRVIRQAQAGEVSGQARQWWQA